MFIKNLTVSCLMILVLLSIVNLSQTIAVSQTMAVDEDSDIFP